MSRWLKISLIIGGLVVLALGGIYWRASSSTEPPRSFEAVPTTIVQDVEFSGRLAAKRSANLSFESTGTIADYLAAESQLVQRGDAIVTLDPDLSELELAKTTADQLSTAEQKKLAFADAERNAQNTKTLNNQTLDKKRQAVRDAKAELDQARNVHNQTDIDSGQSATTETALATLKAKETAYNAAQETLSETVESNKKSNAAAQDTISDARAAYLATVQASGGNAGLASLEALREIARVKLARMTARAPFDGVVTRHHNEVGETVPASSTIATIETIDSLELTADVTETDAAKLAVGMPATITFDALPQQEQWEAEVIYIAPSAQLIEGVPTYQITLEIKADPKEDTRLKPGLTANIIVHAAEKTDVIGIPRRAVITRGGQQHILILEAGLSIREQPVTTGLIGTDGLIEITSGLSGEEQVVIDTTSLRDSQ